MADDALATVLRGKGRDYEAWRINLRSFATAQNLQDFRETLTAARTIVIGQNAPVEDIDERLKAAEVVWAQPVPEGYAHDLELLWSSCFFTALMWGDRTRAEMAASRCHELADRVPRPAVRLVELGLSAVLAAMDGALEDCLALGAEMRGFAESAGIAPVGRQLAGQVERRALLYFGRPEEALAGIAEPTHLWALGGVFAAQRAIYLEYSGRHQEAASIIDEFLATRDLARETT